MKTPMNAHVWERDPDDWYVEPEWCSRRLFEVEDFPGHGAIWDPACGSGRIVVSAQAAHIGRRVIGSDKIRRATFDGIWSFPVDFMTTDLHLGAHIVSNPPFGIADEFVRRALAKATGKVAMLLPVKWLSGDRRASWLAETPLRRVWFLTPRPSMPPGRMIQEGVKPGGDKKDYCWVVWLAGYDGRPEFRHLRRDG